MLREARLVSSGWLAPLVPGQPGILNNPAKAWDSEGQARSRASLVLRIGLARRAHDRISPIRDQRPFPAGTRTGADQATSAGGRVGRALREATRTLSTIEQPPTSVPAGSTPFTSTLPLRVDRGRWSRSSTMLRTVMVLIPILVSAEGSDSHAADKGVKESELPSVDLGRGTGSSACDPGWRLRHGSRPAQPRRPDEQVAPIKRVRGSSAQ